MAVAFDAASRSTTGFDNGPISYTHTPVGVPRAVVVQIGMEATTDQITGVTYGGVAMTRVTTRALGSAGQVFTYFLGSGIPTGPQTVAVTATAGSNDWAACTRTFTAAANTTATAVTPVTATGSTANPSLSISPTAQAAIVYALWDAAAAPVTTVQAGSTHRFGNDFGVDCTQWADKTVAGAGATTIGYTLAAVQWAHQAVAVQEVAGSATRVPLLRRRSGRPVRHGNARARVR